MKSFTQADRGGPVVYEVSHAIDDWGITNTVGCSGETNGITNRSQGAGLGDDYTCIS